MFDSTLNYTEPPKRFETMYYIPPHAVTAFKKRICSDLSTKEVREIILLELQKKKIVDYQRYNHKIQPVYEGNYNNIKFHIPVMEDEKKKVEPWLVVPTILHTNMRIYNRNLETMTATEAAIEFGVDRTTVIDWIKKGKIKAKKHKKNAHWQIYNIEVKRVKKKGLLKPYAKFSKNYSDAEIGTILSNKDLPNKVLAKMLGRTEASVRAKRCRMRKEGYDV